MTLARIPLAAVVIVLASGGGVAAAWSPTPLSISNSQVTAFRLPHAPSKVDALVAAPEGGVWFTAANGVPGEPRHYILSIERIDSQGRVSRIAERAGANAFARTADGGVWYIGFRCICSLTPDGEVIEYPLPTRESESGEEEVTIAQWAIVAGPEGNLWFSSTRDRIGAKGPSPGFLSRMSPAGEFTEFPLPGSPALPTFATSLAVGAEGNIWFTQFSQDAVGRMEPNGQVSRFQLPRYSGPDDIAAGPDGNLWFSMSDPAGMIGRITPAGEIRRFPLPGRDPQADKIIAGPDGRLWFAFRPGMVGRIAPDGRLSLVSLPDSTGVVGLTVDREGKVWYVAEPGPSCPPGDIACLNADPTEPGIIGRIDPAPLAAGIADAKPSGHGRRARVTISCADGQAGSLCRGSLRLRAGGATIARRGFKLGTDTSRDFDLRLTGAASAKLRRNHRLGIVCTVRIEGGQVQRRAFRLKLPRRGGTRGVPLRDS